MKLLRKLQNNGKSRIKQLISTSLQFEEFWMMKSLTTGFELQNNLGNKKLKDDGLLRTNNI